MAAEVQRADVLSAAEAQELAELERQCAEAERAGTQALATIGHALGRIQAGRLYRGEYRFFEQYAEQRHGLSRAHAYRAIALAQVTEILSPAGDNITNEAQARELAPLVKEPDKLRETWQRAAQAAGGTPTAGQLRAARQPELTATPRPARGEAPRADRDGQAQAATPPPKAQLDPRRRPPGQRPKRPLHPG